MVLAQDAAEASEGVCLERPGLLIVPKRPQDHAEILGREKGGPVVVAEDCAAAGEGVV